MRAISAWLVCTGGLLFFAVLSRSVADAKGVCVMGALLVISMTFIYLLVRKRS